MVYGDGQFDETLREQRLIADRARLRSELKAEYIKQHTNPYRHMAGEGGYLFDPAMQRWMSMRADQYHYFKPTVYTLTYPAIVLGSIIGFAWILKTRRGKRERDYRTGQVSYRNRESKFI